MASVNQMGLIDIIVIMKSLLGKLLYLDILVVGYSVTLFESNRGYFNDCFQNLSRSLETDDSLNLAYTKCSYYQILCRKAASRDRHHCIKINDSYPERFCQNSTQLKPDCKRVQ